MPSRGTQRRAGKPEIQVPREGHERTVVGIKGSPDAVKKAEQLVQEVLDDPIYVHKLIREVRIFFICL